MHILQEQWPAAQLLIFVFNSLREAEFFIELVEDPAHGERGKKDSLSLDKQYDLAFFLIYNSLLNYKAFSQNGRYHSSIQVTHQF